MTGPLTMQTINSCFDGHGSSSIVCMLLATRTVEFASAVAADPAQVVVDVMNPWEQEIKGLMDSCNDLLPPDAESQKHKCLLGPDRSAGINASAAAGDAEDTDCIPTSTKDVDMPISDCGCKSSTISCTLLSEPCIASLAAVYPLCSNAAHSGGW